MNASSANISDLTLAGVRASVHRVNREITPAQEGLLDCCSHIDAQGLVDALNWMLATIRDNRRAGLTIAHQERLASIDNLKDWLSDLVDECS
ncbi:hypothetical protein [Spirosoma sp. 48-14]|uniref:hypothetical protein n=1 Tax=Spirosoma sp. 48-14 TaxID=1895854 RepID=UPI000964ED4D|nr:hypothetical protein [Spirosoma sp. 48-14]OJW74275.1 MAG: hypothetical protein BGO59_14265 [Spirosoma sp. 48-14]